MRLDSIDAAFQRFQEFLLVQGAKPMEEKSAAMIVLAEYLGLDERQQKYILAKIEALFPVEADIAIGTCWAGFLVALLTLEEENPSPASLGLSTGSGDLDPPAA